MMIRRKKKIKTPKTVKENLGTNSYLLLLFMLRTQHTKFNWL